MNLYPGKSGLAVAAAAILAAACATGNPEAETAAAPAAPAAAPATPAATSSAREAPRPRGSAPAPAMANPVAGKGVPAGRSVYYDFDRYDIKPQYRTAIEAHARHLRENPNARVTIEGNGDERGSREYNLALGQRRAESVRQMMRLSGAADGQIETGSFGEEKPKALGHDEASWAENRRSDFIYR